MPDKSTVHNKTYNDGYYFWGYLLGDECMYLMYFGYTSEIDYSGRSNPVPFLRIVGDTDLYVGFPTKICPSTNGEWFV